MNVLSRREEETLLKTTKARALKECDPIVKGTAEIIPKIGTSRSSVSLTQNLLNVPLDA